MSARARVFLLALAFAVPAGAKVSSACAGEDDPARRLACYDEESGRAAAVRANDVVRVSTAQPAPSPLPNAASSKASELACPRTDLEDRWALTPCPNDGRFLVRYHQPVYAILRYSDNPNNPNAADGAQLDAWEAKFQLSLKTRLLDWLDRRHAIWFGYTQQSHWQIFNEADSRPFRETNYQPEVIYAFRPDVASLATWKLLTVGALHESNGRSGTQSRSWNRVYAQFGFETRVPGVGDVELFVRPWWRVPENGASDDNPDITDYLGYGDATLLLRQCGHTVGFMARGNPRTRKGAFQATWSTPPLFGALRGYFQFFTGYGESLIDYNWRQTTVGFGVALNDIVDARPDRAICPGV